MDVLWLVLLRRGNLYINAQYCVNRQRKKKVVEIVNYTLGEGRVNAVSIVEKTWKIPVIIDQFIIQGTLAKQILAEPEEIIAMNGQRLPLRMSVDYISFSAHTGNRAVIM